MVELSPKEAYEAGIRDAAAAHHRIKSKFKGKPTPATREQFNRLITDELNRLYIHRIRTGELPGTLSEFFL